MTCWQWTKDHVLPYWRTYIVILLPVLLLPLPILATYDGDDGKVHKEALAGYVILIMALYWMTEALPLAVTSLIPVVFFPLFGIMDTGSVTMAYMKETNMMFIGGLMVALTIEYCNLHKRIALSVLLLVGSSPRWLMLGFMLVTMFLSMWISNTATTAMMVPIVEAVVQELFKSDVPPSTGDLSTDSAISISETIKESEDDDKHKDEELARKNHSKEMKRMKRIRIGTLMSVAYASNIGGTGSLIGSSPQLAFKGIFENKFPCASVMNFATWMAFNVPGMLINVFLAWIWLQFLFIGFKNRSDPAAEQQVKQLIRRKYKDLGPMTFHEAATLLMFITVVLLWFFRDPQFITGWSELIHDAHVDDATAAIAVVLLLFIIPAKPNFWCFRDHGERGPEKPSEALLNWQYVQDRLPWGIVLLLGGGFALSDASESSGLSAWLGEQLAALKVLPPFVIMLIICIMTATITEVASNTATANILLPILAQMSIKIEKNPIYLMLPAAVTCSYAFMLPVATPPNAIVFSVSKMKPIQLIKAGFLMNIVCVLVLCGLMESYGDLLFDIHTFPDWARPTNSTNCATPEF